VSLTWGTSWLAISVGVRDVPPLTLAGVRMVIGSAAIASFAGAFRTRGGPPRAEFPRWLGIGLANLGVPFALIFWAETRIPSGMTAMLFGTYPAFTAVLAHWMLPHEPLSARRTASVLLAGLAVVLLVGPVGALHGGAFLPVLAVLAASLVSAGGAVLVKRYAAGRSAMWLAVLQTAGAGALLLLLAALFERSQAPRWTPPAIAALLYLALVVTLGCFVGGIWLLQRLPATFVSMAVVVETAVAVFLGAVALHEPVGVNVLVGLGLVIVSVWLAKGE